MKERRLQKLEDYIHSVGVISMEDLCVEFAISMSTLRRDINRLLKQNTIQKVYGGVASLKQNLIPFENRDVMNKSAKELIAEKAVEMMDTNELIFIDSGTTTREIVKYLPKTTKLTILTNSLDIINGVANMSNINLLLIGNSFKHDTRSFVGNDSIALLEKYNISKAFMAATAVSIESGLTNSEVQEYEIKKRVVEKAREVYLLADISKFDRSTLLTYANLKDIDGIITSQPLAEKYVNYCQENDIRIYIAD